ncbi:MAG: hypothetical protein ACRDTP_03065, partial [Mycobacteriales bacterium]
LGVDGQPSTGARRVIVDDVKIEVDLAALLRSQCFVASRTQLAERGVDRHHIRAQVRAARWRTAGPHVIRTTTGVPTVQQRWWIAVLHAGPRSLLAGLTAAQSHGLQGWPSPEVHVLVPYECQVDDLAGVRIHRTRQWRAHPGSPPRSPIAEALVDAATWARTDAAAVGVLAAGVQQRLVTAGALRTPAARSFGRRALLRAVCADLEGGAEALSEIRLGPIAAFAGLPEPNRQAVRTDAAGRRRYLDADFGSFSVEIDGMPHLEVRRHAADLQRQNDLALAGERILRFSALSVRTDESSVARQLRRAHALWN